jgi:uncharacterized membrane protein
MDTQAPAISIFGTTVSLLTFCAALGAGLVAGVCFAFSSFVMPALSRIAPAQGVAAMQSINVVALNRWFMGAFMGTSAACAMLAIGAVATWSEPGARLRFAASAVYLAGVLLVTGAFNVPLNDALEKLPAQSAEAASEWPRYVSTWIVWNHVRVAASLASAALFTLALLRSRLAVHLVAACFAALGVTGCTADQVHPLAPPGSTTPVTKLSELGIFKGNPARQIPRDQFVAYDVNVSVYSDGEQKHRFVHVPPGTRIHATADRWDLPVGTYLVKTFSFPIDARRPSAGERLIETRVLVKTARGLVGSIYLWNDEQTDAVASAGNVDVPVSWVDARGVRHDDRVHVPGTSECWSCHQERALGWRSGQLDRQGSFADGTHDQIDHFVRLGIVDARPPQHLVLSDPLGSASLDARARSYLDANCAHCHGAGGIAEDTSLYALEPGHPEHSEMIARMLSSDTSYRMPRGPTRTADRAGIDVLSAWIAQMKPAQSR